MMCSGCGNETYAKRSVLEHGQWLESCDRCGEGSIPGIADVYFRSPGDHYGLYDPKTASPIYITSKAHKAQVMKEQHLSEAGDRKHGAINFDEKYSRAAHENERRTR